MRQDIKFFGTVLAIGIGLATTSEIFRRANNSEHESYNIVKAPNECKDILNFSNNRQYQLTCKKEDGTISLYQMRTNNSWYETRLEIPKAYELKR